MSRATGLRVLAVSAPQFPAGRIGDKALSSADPVSLYNACRLAAEAAAHNIGPWGDSNFAGNRATRRAATFLLHSADEFEELERQITAVRPHLVFIGAMSVCFPGAIACARLVKEILGDRVCVVLGGRHPNESVYELPGGRIGHHPSSPLLLMAQGAIDPVFDLVVSGDGEGLIRAIGELVHDVVQGGGLAASSRERLEELVSAPGRWLAGTLRDGHIETVVGRGGLLAYASLPSPAELFGVRTAFDVFGGRPTAQVFSDVGRGCIYDCQFCSERRSITGAPAQLDGSPDRLFRHFESAVRTIQEDYPGARASAFVEDSTLLTFAPNLVNRFVELLAASRLDVRFGGQLTIDQVLSRTSLLTQLQEVGLDYLFIGLETTSPISIGGMSKDVGGRFAPWITRAESVFSRLADLGIQCGVALLFGIGEPHTSRLELASQLAQWQAWYGRPYPISINWAVQHPLHGEDGGTGYTYTDWAVPEGPFLPLFQDFGEASVCYPMAGQPRPVFDEVREVHAAFAALTTAPSVTVAGQGFSR